MNEGKIITAPGASQCEAPCQCEVGQDQPSPKLPEKQVSLLEWLKLREASLIKDLGAVQNAILAVQGDPQFEQTLDLVKKCR